MNTNDVWVTRTIIGRFSILRIIYLESPGTYPPIVGFSTSEQILVRKNLSKRIERKGFYFLFLERPTKEIINHI